MEEQGIFIERILSNENMNRAYKQVKKNKGAAGIDGMECADLLSHLKVNGRQLRESIRNQSYKPMPVKRVEIPKADGSKRKTWYSNCHRSHGTTSSCTGINTYI